MKFIRAYPEIGIRFAFECYAKPVGRPKFPCAGCGELTEFVDIKKVWKDLPVRPTCSTECMSKAEEVK